MKLIELPTGSITQRRQYYKQIFDTVIDELLKQNSDPALYSNTILFGNILPVYYYNLSHRVYLDCVNNCNIDNYLPSYANQPTYSNGKAVLILQSDEKADDYNANEKIGEYYKLEDAFWELTKK